MPDIIFELGKSGGINFEIEADAVTVGRSRDNVIQLLDGRVSREHCIIQKQGTGLLIKDLGSVNGTVVNDGVVEEERELRVGDTILMGDCRLVVAAGAHDVGYALKICPKEEDAVPKDKGFETLMAEAAGEAKRRDVARVKSVIDTGDRTDHFIRAFQQLGYSPEDALQLAREAKGEASETFPLDDIDDVVSVKPNEIVVMLKRQVPGLGISAVARYRGEDYMVFGIECNPETMVVTYRLKHC